MDLDLLFQNEEFKCLSEEQLLAYRRLYESVKGKNQLECMGAVLEFQRSMPKGRKMSPSENKAMILCIMDAMDECERERFVEIVKLLDNF